MADIADVTAERMEVQEAANIAEIRRKAAEMPKAVYGVRPLSFTYDRESGFVRVESSGGVSVARLREMTKQIRYLKG